jgi:predicted nucleic acid-binding protein
MTLSEAFMAFVDMGGSLLNRPEAAALTGSLIPDAQLAGLAIEHGVAVYSTDANFARFSELRRVDPLRG